MNNKNSTLILLALFFFSNGYTQTIQWIAQPKYDAISPFHEGVAYVSLDGKSGYVNRQGKEIVKPEYDKVFNFNDEVGVITTSDFEIMAIANKSGKLTTLKSGLKVDPRFAQFSDGLLLVTDGKKWGYMNKSGNLQIECKYIAAHPYSEGLAAVTSSAYGIGGWAFINPSGNGVILQDNNFTWASSFIQGRALVIFSKQLAYIDTQGKRIEGNLPKLNSAMERFDTFKGEIKLKEGIAFFDGQGRFQSVETQTKGKQSFLTSDIRSENNLILIKKEGNKSGFIIKGKPTLCQFDEVSWFDNTTAIVKKDASYGIVSLDENNSISVTFKKDTFFSVFGKPAIATVVVKNLKPKEISNLNIRFSEGSQQSITTLKSEESKELVLSLTKNTDASFEEKVIEFQPDLDGILQNLVKIKAIIQDKPSLRIEFAKSSYEVKSGEKIPVTFKIANETAIDTENIAIKVLEKSDIIYESTQTIHGNSVVNCQISISALKSQIKELEIIVKPVKAPPIKMVQKISLTITDIDSGVVVHPGTGKIKTEVNVLENNK